MTDQPGKETPLRDQIFTAPFEQRFLRWYRNFFSIREIEDTKTLQWALGALLFAFYTTFYGWIGISGLTLQSYLSNNFSCWPYFQGCGRFHVLEALPYGYSQTILYVGFFALMALIVYLIWKREWVLAHLGFFILWLWKFAVVFILADNMGGNYDYYDVFLGFIFLFLPHKLFFLKISFIMFYFLSSTIKIHEGWVLGTYFTSLITGLPVFGDSLAPLVTNLVIFMQIVGAWLLLSENRILQRGALIYFLFFHLYSGILVEYRYLATSIPMLLILFGPMYQPTAAPSVKKSIAGWSFIGILFTIQFTPILFIKGDQKMTLEGNTYGFYMFEANHQCVSTVTTVREDGTRQTKENESILARARCNPYRTWFKIQQTCKRERETLDRVQWTFDHSINGGPFYRIIDEKNVCLLEYRPFKHNEWIKLPEENPPVMGYPVKNIFY